MQECPKQDGVMYAVRASAEEVEAGIQKLKATDFDSSLASTISMLLSTVRRSVTLAGAKLAVEELLNTQRLRNKQLQVSHAFHSPLMAPAAEDLKNLYQQSLSPHHRFH